MAKRDMETHGGSLPTSGANSEPEPSSHETDLVDACSENNPRSPTLQYIDEPESIGARRIADGDDGDIVEHGVNVSAFRAWLLEFLCICVSVTCFAGMWTYFNYLFPCGCAAQRNIS
jgi:hypothetical protein